MEPAPYDPRLLRRDLLAATLFAIFLAVMWLVIDGTWTWERVVGSTALFVTCAVGGRLIAHRRGYRP